MELDILRRALHQQPFQPFLLRLADGRAVAVKHPDFVAVAPTGRSAIVYGVDGSYSFLEPLLDVSIDFEGSNPSSN